ncbi:MAG: ThuA domain-containing protein [Cytophagales bacterium]|nr:ThuA domain-containing protein [Cytophagales bacterium]
MTPTKAITLLLLSVCLAGCKPATRFTVLAFYTTQHDAAHISFVHEANTWFSQQAGIHHFKYDTTRNWNDLTKSNLSEVDVIVFLDSRPDDSVHRLAFQNYMKRGGSWMGFHFAGFALTPSAYPQNWDWYHSEFLGAGQYASNTWRPTAAVLATEAVHPATTGLPKIFTSAPNEWYRWQNDLRLNQNIEILVAIDSTSFPLGTGPKAHEIWYSGYYPVVWTNKNYRMIYFNMGHNNMDYESGSNQTLSSTFSSAEQNQLILNSLLWLGTKSSAND